jgi:glycosyltransferase involved in cell wall biosynthesis
VAVCDHPSLPEARNIRSAIIVNSVAKHTWLVVPLYNEAQVVREVIEHARTVFPNIVCVDDGSSDASVAEARAGGATVVQHPFNLGQGAALRTGLDYALGQPGAEYFVTFDSDGQHRVDDALAMAERLATGTVDVVVGSRFLDDRTQPGALKKLVLKTAVLFENLSTGVKLTDAHNGLRAFNRTAATKIRIEQNRMAHASEIVAEIGRNKLRYVEMPVHVVYTDYSKSKGQSIWNSVNILSDLYFK